MKRNSMIGTILVLVLVAIMFTPAVSMAAVRMFVLISGIPGESQDLRHKDWIEGMGYGEGILVPVSSSGGGVIGRPEVAPIKIMKFLDRASPKLRDYLVDGRVIKSVRIEFWTDGEVSNIISRIELFEARIVEVSTTLANGSPDRPQELVAFDFPRIRWTYWWYKPDGSVGGTVVAEYVLSGGGM